MKKYIIVILCLLPFVLLFGNELSTAKDYGSYTRPFTFSFCLEGRSIKLERELIYTDPEGKKWVAPKGSVVDGASIPQFLWSIVGGPLEDRYREASVIHDVACDSKKEPYEVVHKMFYNAMRASGVSHQEASSKYLAVKLFGPKWGEFPVSIRKDCFTGSKKEALVIEDIGVAIDKNDQYDFSTIIYNKKNTAIISNDPNIILINSENKKDIKRIIKSKYKEEDIDNFYNIYNKIKENSISIEQIDIEINKLSK